MARGARRQPRRRPTSTRVYDTRSPMIGRALTAALTRRTPRAPKTRFTHPARRHDHRPDVPHALHLKACPLRQATESLAVEVEDVIRPFRPGRHLSGLTFQVARVARKAVAEEPAVWHGDDDGPRGPHQRHQPRQRLARARQVFEQLPDDGSIEDALPERARCPGLSSCCTNVLSFPIALGMASAGIARPRPRVGGRCCGLSRRSAARGRRSPCRRGATMTTMVHRRSWVG